MEISFDTTPEKFLQRCGAALEAREAENNIILSVCAREKEGSFISVHENGEFLLAAVQAGKRNLILSHDGGADLEDLASAMKEKNLSFPGVIGPSNVSAAFAEIWARQTGRKTGRYVDQLLYDLRRVTAPQDVSGEFGFAMPKEADIAAKWIRDFAILTLPNHENIDAATARREADEKIRNKHIAFWRVEGEPVSMAAVNGVTRNTARVGGVYTPEENRGQGYASAVVAGLSQSQLESGKKICCLYADAGNPVSNSIYRQIGYEFVGRSTLYTFA